MLAGSRRSAVDGVAANGEGLDERELVVAELRGNVELARREEQALAHAAVAHHAERLVVFAAVREAAAAGVTALAIDVRLDRAVVAGCDIGHAFAHGEDLDAEFVAGDAGVGKERHFAEEAAVVRPADADAVVAHQRLARRGRGGLREFEGAEFLRGVERDGFHGNVGGSMARRPAADKRGGAVRAKEWVGKAHDRR